VWDLVNVKSFKVCASTSRIKFTSTIKANLFLSEEMEAVRVLDYSGVVIIVLVVVLIARTLNIPFRKKS
jgi:hypothetical protein